MAGGFTRWAAAATAVAVAVAPAWSARAAVAPHNAAPVGCVLLETSSPALQVNVSKGGVSYTVLVDGDVWFDSGNTSVTVNGRTRSVADGSLELVSSNVTRGSDGAGPYDALSFDWAVGGVLVWTTTFKAYDHDPPTVVFQQTYNIAVLDAQGGSRFPDLVPRFSPGRALGALEYTGESCGFMVESHGSVAAIKGGNGNGAIVVSPRDLSGNGTTASLAIGPVDEFFVNTAWPGAVAYGVAPTFTHIPHGFQVETAVVATSSLSSSSSAVSAAAPVAAAADRHGAGDGDDGIRVSIPRGGTNAALASYGDFILARHNKTRAAGDINNITKYLGYSTTGCSDPMPDGQSSHDRTRCEHSPIPGCATYGDTLRAVHESLTDRDIPYRHMLLDSWWYGEGFHGGVWKWEDEPDVVNVSFPQSLKAFWGDIGHDKSVWAHNGKWSHTPYAQQFDFTPDGELPQGDGLWQHLFGANREWGLQTIKQDHMNENMRACATAFTNVSVLKSWVAGMGKGAADNDVGVLYCCAPPSVHMSGVTVPAAWGVRASPDYVWQAHGSVLHLPQVQWAIGPDSAYHWLAFGLLPYKDTFFSNSTMMQTSGGNSTDPNQWPQFHGYAESDPLTHALMSVLSTAPVTFSDAVDATNKSLIMMTCRADGVVLKPDRPATAIDAQFQAMMFGTWPSSGGAPGVPAGHGRLSLTPCVDGGQNDHQLWHYDAGSGVLALAQGEATCADLEKCATADGSPVLMFRNPAGCGHGPGTCGGKNELWVLRGGNGTSASTGAGITAPSTGTIESQWAPGQCLVADAMGLGAALVACSSAAAQATQYQFVPDSQNASRVTIQFSQHDDTLCLTGGDVVPASAAPPPSLSLPRTPAVELDDVADLDVAAIAADESLSPGRRHALVQSALFIKRLANRTKHLVGLDHYDADGGGGSSLAEAATALVDRAGDGSGGEQCLGLASPQGPVGEIYSTHTTLAASTPRSSDRASSSSSSVTATGRGDASKTATTSFTWFYAVGMQVSSPYNFTTADLGDTASAAGAPALVAVPFSYDSVFRPAAAADVRPFGDAAPITFGADARDTCGAAGDVRYPVQYYTIAPVLPNGMVLLGETGKLVPVSAQRVTALDVAADSVVVGVRGRAGEAVEFAALGAAGQLVFATATIAADGTASLTLSANGGE